MTFAELWVSWWVVPVAFGLGFVLGPVWAVGAALLNGDSMPRGKDWLAAPFLFGVLFGAVSALGVAGSRS